MALAEKAGIKYRIDSDDAGAVLDMDDGDADEEEAMLVEKAQNVAEVARRKKLRENGESGVPDGVLPQQIVEKIEALPMPGLLDRQEMGSGEEMIEQDSLLARGEDE